MIYKDFYELKVINYFFQPGDGLKSVTFYTEDEQAYREQIWKLDTKVNDGWNLAQVKIVRDYDFMIFVEVIRAGGEVGQIVIDDFVTVQDDVCGTLPVQAEPTTPTTPATTTTPEPTEGPQRETNFNSFRV